MKVKILTNNAYVITNPETNEIILQSYDSIVARITKSLENNDSYAITLGRHWNYSITTLKHVYSFLIEYAPADLNLSQSKTRKRSIEKLISQEIIRYDENLA